MYKVGDTFTANSTIGKELVKGRTYLIIKIENKRYTLKHIKPIMAHKITDTLKDWEIAKIVWGSNNKEQCRAIKKLRKKCVITPICDDWYQVQTVQESEDDEVGLMVPLECLEAHKPSPRRKRLRDLAVTA